MKTNDKIKFLEKVMMSCRTLDQLEVAQNWIDKILQKSHPLSKIQFVGFTTLKHQMEVYILLRF